MDTPKIEISTDGINAVVRIDGNNVSDKITGYKLRHTAGNIPVLSIDFIATNLTVDGKMVPELPDVLKPFYKRIGE
jgi:hypothetical protein